MRINGGVLRFTSTVVELQRIYWKEIYDSRMRCFIWLSWNMLFTENVVSSLGFIKLQKNVKWESLYFQPPCLYDFKAIFKHYSHGNAFLLPFSSFRFRMFSVFGPVFGWFSLFDSIGAVCAQDSRRQTTHHRVILTLGVPILNDVIESINGIIPDNKVYGANIRSIWGRQDPGWPNVGPMNFAIWDFMPEKLVWNEECCVKSRNQGQGK